MTVPLLAFALASLVALAAVTSRPDEVRDLIRGGLALVPFRRATGRHHAPSPSHAGGWSAWVRRNR